MQRVLNFVIVLCSLILATLAILIVLDTFKIDIRSIVGEFETYWKNLNISQMFGEDEKKGTKIGTGEFESSLYDEYVRHCKSFTIKEVSRSWMVLWEDSKNEIIVVSVEKYTDNDGVKRRKIISYEELGFWDKIMLQKVEGRRHFHFNQ